MRCCPGVKGGGAYGARGGERHAPCPQWQGNPGCATGRGRIRKARCQCQGTSLAAGAVRAVRNARASRGRRRGADVTSALEFRSPRRSASPARQIPLSSPSPDLVRSNFASAADSGQREKVPLAYSEGESGKLFGTGIPFGRFWLSGALFTPSVHPDLDAAGGRFLPHSEDGFSRIYDWRGRLGVLEVVDYGRGALFGSTGLWSVCVARPSMCSESRLQG